MDKRIICPACKETENKDIFMQEKHGTYSCPSCKTSISLGEEPPLDRFVDIWRDIANELYILLRSPLQQNVLSNPRLFLLYEDCYFSLLIGRFNASIVLMGVLLEALMKERIRLKLGIDFRGPYGACLKLIEKKKLLQVEDIYFLENFKKYIRNPYQHADEREILLGKFTKVWPIEFEGDVSFKKIKAAHDAVSSGKISPKMVPAWSNPTIRSIVKNALDKKISIKLFNQVYDFLLVFNHKYLKEKDYQEHNKKFGSELNSIEHYRF